MFKRFSILVASVFLLCLLVGPNSAMAAEGDDAISIPDGASSEQVKDIMAGMSDEQVRTLLIEELKKDAVKKPVDTGPKGIAGIVQSMKSGAALVRDRFEYLFSGATSAPRELPETLRGVLVGDGKLTPGRLVLGLAVLSLLWLGAMYLYRRKTAAARLSIEITPADSLWYTRMGRLFLRALLDLFGMVIILVIVFALYLFLLDETHSGKPVIIAWLGAMVFLELTRLILRFILAPKAPALRYRK